MFHNSMFSENLDTIKKKNQLNIDNSVFTPMRDNYSRLLNSIDNNENEQFDNFSKYNKTNYYKYYDSNSNFSETCLVTTNASRTNTDISNNLTDHSRFEFLTSSNDFLGNENEFKENVIPKRPVNLLKEIEDHASSKSPSSHCIPINNDSINIISQTALKDIILNGEKNRKMNQNINQESNTFLQNSTQEEFNSPLSKKKKEPIESTACLSNNKNILKTEINNELSSCFQVEHLHEIPPKKNLNEKGDIAYISKKKESLNRSNSFSNKYNPIYSTNNHIHQYKGVSSHDIDKHNSPTNSKGLSSHEKTIQYSNPLYTQSPSIATSLTSLGNFNAQSDEKLHFPLIGTNKTRSKLTALQDKIIQFEGQLQIESQNRREAEKNRLNALREAVICLEKTLNAEVRRRLEANKTIQFGFESQLANLEASIDKSISSRNDQLSGAIETLSSRIQEAETEMRNLKEQHNTILEKIENQIYSAITEIHSIKDTLETELKARRQKEAIILDRLMEVEKQMDNRLALEKGIRQKDLDDLKSTIESVHENHIALDDAFQQNLATEFHELKMALEAESQAREQADDDIVQALNHYTAALQCALRIANST